MPYAWHNEALILQTHHWCLYNSFLNVIRRARYISFSVKAQREGVRNALENMQINLPFSVNNRFPDEAIYIDLDHSVPSRLLTQIMLALDFSDRQAEKGRVIPDSVEVRSYSNFEDAKVAYYQAVGNFIDLVGPMAVETAHIFGVYTRSSFEAEHSLNWQ
ncbi:ORF5 [Adelphocoris suturalis virus]|uniref:ORF5 n=1 Tax=Adelphocoris suturalis virus TaxID=1930920 RepID=UPI0009503791|nr:ORF5 [Adelphocoris suturalis virus]APT35497.1 ORF5 [Adelphocoris suturalis virus]